MTCQTEAPDGANPGLQVAYAVRFADVAGEAGLAELDRRMIEQCQAIDPDVRITRGDLVPRRSNSYPSAGFLHDGAPRASEAGPMPEMSPDDVALREQAEALAQQLSGTATMVFLDGNWHGSVHYVGEGNRHYYIQVTGGWT
jgi:hypothetical protein